MVPTQLSRVAEGGISEPDLPQQLCHGSEGGRLSERQLPGAMPRQQLPCTVVRSRMPWARDGGLLVITDEAKGELLRVTPAR